MKKLMLIIVIFLAISLLHQFNYQDIIRRIRIQTLPNNNLSCFYKTMESLPDILNARPALNRSIFFHETSCTSYNNGKVTINSRQACAVESAARQNPNFEIYLLYLSPGVIKYDGTESDRFLKVLQSFKNVKILRINIDAYFKGTLLEHLVTEGTIFKSAFPLSHLSDVLRYLTLWRYGGIYLDLDVIVTKSLEKLPLNFAAYESADIATGVIGFASSGPGHEFINFCLMDLHKNFDGYQWSNNGNGVFSRVLSKYCVKDTIKNTTKFTECFGNVTIYPPEMFYPVGWQVWTHYFKSENLEEVEKISKNSYVLHLWNKLSSDWKLPVVKTDVPYVAFARKYCPKVFNECDKFF